MATTPTKPAALTIGQSVAHMSRAKIWAIAILSSLMFPAIVGGIVHLNLQHTFPGSLAWSFLTGVPWRLALVLAWCAYISMPWLVRSYAELYLPRTPVAVAEKMVNVGFWGVGLTVALMVGLVLGLQVKDTCVLAGLHRPVPAASIVGLVAFWVWLARTYGGNASESSESNSSDVARLPV